MSLTETINRKQNEHSKQFYQLVVCSYETNYDNSWDHQSVTIVWQEIPFFCIICYIIFCNVIYNVFSVNKYWVFVTDLIFITINRIVIFLFCFSYFFKGFHYTFMHLTNFTKILFLIKIYLAKSYMLPQKYLNQKSVLYFKVIGGGRELIFLERCRRWIYFKH